MIVARLGLTFMIRKKFVIYTIYGDEKVFYASTVIAAVNRDLDAFV